MLKTGGMGVRLSNLIQSWGRFRLDRLETGKVVLISNWLANGLANQALVLIVRF